MATAGTTRADAPPAVRRQGPVGLLGEGFPWRLLLENTIVGISYMQDRRFLWANARMAEIFGYRPGELDGEPVRCLYVTQEDYEDVGRLMAGARQDGFVTHERGMARRDGSLIWCRISGRVVHRADAGSASVWVVQDLSDKKRAEDDLRRMNQRLEQTVERRTTNLRRSNDALQAQIERGRELQTAVVASREKYRTLFRHLPLGVLVVDAGGTLVEFNRTLQTYLGASTRARLDELVVDDARVLLAEGHTTSLASLIRQRMPASGTRADRFEFGWLAPSGKRREIAVIAVRLSAAGNGAVFTLADMTEQHRRREREHAQQAALAHASRLSLMGQMASALAHELGQPLNACQSYLSGLRHRLGDALDDRPELLAALDKAAQHLEQAGQIVRNVRGFVARQAPEFSAVDLPALVAQTLHLLELPIRAASVRTRVEVAPALPPARANPVEIQQVLVNLVINAIEAMDGLPLDARVVQLRLQRDAQGLLVVEVADQGPGIAPALATRIFEPYVTTKAAGLGMGLMISRTIVESHGGALKLLRHKPPGATLRFTLPAWERS